MRSGGLPTMSDTSSSRLAPKRSHAALLSWLAGLLLLLSGCASVPPRPADTPLAFVLVRHAEKATDDPDNPSLDAAGHARAQALAAELRDVPLAAIYATEYRRTQQTAEPAARQHRLPVTAYFAKASAAQNAERWRRQHTRGTVLIVGHSNTVPDLAAALCGCTIAPMDDGEYDRFIQVRFDASGNAQVDTRRYGAPHH